MLAGKIRGNYLTSSIDDGAETQRSIGRREQAPCAGELREYAAAVDIPDKHPSPVQVMAGPQIHQVAAL